jgi:hypothetical protein
VVGFPWALTTPRRAVAARAARERVSVILMMDTILVGVVKE